MSGTVPFPWKTNVMGILGDCRVLFASVLCPALSYYATSELFERPPAGVVESCIGGYCLCCGFLLRTRLREKYNLDGSFLGDFVAHLCCHCVALARIWREAEMQMEAEKQHPQSQVQPLHPPQQNVVQLGPGPQQSVIQLGPGPQQIHNPYMMHPSGHQQFLHPGLQQLQPINQMPPAVQQMQPIGFVNPYQQRPIYMPQQAIVVQQQPEQQNTIDTNLSSDFESSNHGLTGQETVHSYNRNDSIDPPPSNNDPDPWSMLPALHASSQRPIQQPPVHEAPPEVHRPKRTKSKRRTEAVGITYEEVVAKEMADNISPESRPFGLSPFSLPNIPSDDSAPKNMDMTERLEKLRPNTAPKPGAEVGASFKSVKDNSDLVDEIMLGDTKLVSAISMPKELEVEDPLQSTSQHEDPPQHMDRSGSVNTKHDDSSLVTYGATVGSELHNSLHLASIEIKKTKEESA